MEVFDLETEQFRVSERWKAQYEKTGWQDTHMKNGHVQSSYLTYTKILEAEKLSVNQRYDAIDAIIGNTCWTHRGCDCCQETIREPLISFSFGGGDRTVEICKQCLSKGLRKLRRYNRK